MNHIFPLFPSLVFSTIYYLFYLHQLRFLTLLGNLFPYLVPFVPYLDIV